MVQRRPRLAIATLFLPWLAFNAPAQADDQQYRAVGDLAIYLGVLPAELVRGHERVESEPKEHPRAQRRPHSYHVVVAIFDAKTGARVENAEVVASIAPTGLAGQRHRLRPMKISDSVTYGAYIDLPGNDRYAIKLEIRAPNRPAPVKADFAYEHRLR